MNTEYKAKNAKNLSAPQLAIPFKKRLYIHWKIFPHYNKIILFFD